MAARMRPQSTPKMLLNGDLAVSEQQVETRQPQSAHPEEFEHFFTQSLDMLCIAGLDGYFKRVNPAWTTRLGWKVEELTSKPFFDFVHPDDVEITQTELSKLGQGVVTILFENRYRHQDGSYHWLEWNARPVEGSQKIYAIARDVTQQKLLEREILEIADLEKERLGRELHDGLCQSLAGIAALSLTLSRRLEGNSDSTQSAAAAEITRLLNETIKEAHNLARGLGPVGLRAAGLDGAVEALALNVQHLFGVSCTLDCDGPFPRLGCEHEAHLYRVAQEAVNNAVAHGRAERIEISLSSKDGKGLLSVRDDGGGMGEKARSPDGIGLHTMTYRARLIGGSLEVQQRTPKGTAVTCTFPLPELPETPPDKSKEQNNARNRI